MAVELRLLFDGETRGLREHRLSLSLFGPALQQLLAAARRIASNILKDALDAPDLGARGGALAKGAEQIDLELTGVREGCADVGLACTYVVKPGQNLDLFEGLPERVADELLTAIEQESKGHLRNVGVRRFLSALPAGVTRQRYSMWRNGKEQRLVEFGHADLPEAPADMPRLIEIVAQVAGVGFEPGKNEVRLKAEEGGRTLGALATEAQVNRAIDLRGVRVRAMVLRAEGEERLLWLRGAEGPARVLATPDKQKEQMFAKWDGLLRRLAK
jgi:hypothetical protein